MLLTTFYKENDASSYKAEIHENNLGFTISYYSPDGSKINSVNYMDKTIHQIEDIAETWISSIKTLNG